MKTYNQVSPPSREQIDTAKANLMDALRESLKTTGARESSASSKKTKAKPVAKRQAG